MSAGNLISCSLSLPVFPLILFKLLMHPKYLSIDEQAYQDTSPRLVFLKGDDLFSGFSSIISLHCKVHYILGDPHSPSGRGGPLLPITAYPIRWLCRLTALLPVHIGFERHRLQIMSQVILRDWAENELPPPLSSERWKLGFYKVAGEARGLSFAQL